MTLKDQCCCQSGLPFEACCSPFLSGNAFPQNPEQLMRSRYTAFCTKNIEYLVDTHHPSKRQADERDALLKTIRETQWFGLRIIKADKPAAGQMLGFVEFAAFYKAGTLGQIHENSRFVLENGRWFYLDGEFLDPVSIGRKEPCFCGSGRKYKKCHGK